MDIAQSTQRGFGGKEFLPAVRDGFLDPSRGIPAAPIAAEATTVDDYQAKVTKKVSSAGALAACTIRKDQCWYKASYNWKSFTRDYKLRDWVFVKLPQQERQRQRKFSRPWHDPYRIVTKGDPN